MMISNISISCLMMCRYCWMEIRKWAAQTEYSVNSFFESSNTNSFPFITPYKE